MLAALRYPQRARISLARSASANCKKGPKLIRADAERAERRRVVLIRQGDGVDRQRQLGGQAPQRIRVVPAHRIQARRRRLRRPRVSRAIARSTRSDSSPSWRRNRSVRALTTTCTPAASAALRSAPTSAACSCGRPQPAALAVHGVLDVQPDRPGAEQTVDEALRLLPVAGFDVDGYRNIHRTGDLRRRG